MGQLNWNNNINASGIALGNSINQEIQMDPTQRRLMGLFLNGNVSAGLMLNKANPELFNQASTQKEVNERYSLLAQKPGKNPSVMGSNLGKNWGSLLG